MIALLQKYNSKLVFDGINDGSIVVPIILDNKNIEVKINNSLYFSKIRELISLDSFEEIIYETNHAIESSIFPGNYTGTQNLPLRFCLVKVGQEELLVVLSFGEYQPSRYKVFLESVWLLSVLNSSQQS